MKSTFKIKKIVDLKEDANMEMEAGDNYLVSGDKMVIFGPARAPNADIEELSKTTDACDMPPTDPTKPLSEEEKESEEDKEFRRKWQIRPGLHFLNAEKGMIKITPQDEIYYETLTAKSILGYFECFYNKMDVLNKYKKSKRSYLLHSDPGMGKSAFLRFLSRRVMSKSGIAIIQTSGSINFDLLMHIFMKPYHEDVKIILLIIEDMGQRNYSNNTNYYNPSCLNFLDGQESLFRVPTMIIATTNFAKELGPQFTNRPGRFNKIIKIEPPSDGEIFELVESFSGTKLTDSQKEALSGKSLTPDHCIEVILRSEIEGMSLERAASEVMKERHGLTEFPT